MSTPIARIMVISFLTLAACAAPDEAGDMPSGMGPEAVAAQAFGNLPDGRPVTLYTLTNQNGMVMKVTDYGGTITSLTAPDRDGRFEDIVLGFDELQPYLDGTPYFGAIIGRYGNRIARGQFELDGESYTLAKNNGENHLHGGEKGFDKVLWGAEPFESTDGPGLLLKYTSQAGEEGYPGTLMAQVSYTLSHDNRLMIYYEATSHAATPVNLTQHSYFNLAGVGRGGSAGVSGAPGEFPGTGRSGTEMGSAAAANILGHELQIHASAFTPVDAGLIPTGEIRSVEGTPFDFREPVAIGARIDAQDEQISRGPGYDHNFVLDGDASVMRPAATVREPLSGRVMEVWTEEPGLQFYAGNFLDGTLTGKGGYVYGHRSGFCLETQHFPDSPNQPAFPSTILRPGKTYQTRTTYAFSTDS